MTTATRAFLTTTTALGKGGGRGREREGGSERERVAMRRQSLRVGIRRDNKQVRGGKELARPFFKPLPEKLSTSD